MHELSYCTSRDSQQSRFAESPAAGKALSLHGRLSDTFFAARRYASAVLAVPLAPCLSASLSDCLSQVGVLSRRLDESNWFLV